MNEKHSAEPWKVDHIRSGSDDAVIYANILGPDSKELMSAASVEDATRIVICINALTGVPNDEIVTTIKRGLAERYWDEERDSPDWLRTLAEK